MLAAMTVPERTGATKFILTLGGKADRPMMRAVTAWFRQESGSVKKVIGNNPFNIRPWWASYLADGRRVVPGNGLQDMGFLTFPTLEIGFQAAAVVLLKGGASFGYGHVVASLRRGDEVGFLANLALSSWCATHYGVDPRSDKNHLVALFNQIPA